MVSKALCWSDFCMTFARVLAKFLDLFDSFLQVLKMCLKLL